MSRIWRTKEGKEILIEDMGTDHIKNCIKMLERRYEELDGQIVEGDIWDEIPDGVIIYFNSPEEMFPILKDLRKELEKRVVEESEL